MKNLKLLLVIPAFLVVRAACPAEDSGKEPTQLSLLRKSRQQSRERAVQHPDATYAQELQKLLDTYTKTGRLDEAVITKAELAKLGTEESTKVGAPNGEAGKEPAELASLKRSWHQAREAAVKPIDATYVQELQKMLGTFTKAGRLEDALAVKNELAKAGGTAPVAASVAGVRDGPAPPYVGKRWGTASGSHFLFQADGTGTQENASGKKWPLKWTKGQNETLIVDGWANDEKATLYFRFTKSTEGVFGSSAEKLDKKISVK